VTEVFEEEPYEEEQEQEEEEIVFEEENSETTARSKKKKQGKKKRRSNMSSSDSESSDSESGSNRRFKIGAKLPTFKDDDIITYKMQMEAHMEDKGLAEFLEPHPGMPQSFDGNLNLITDKKERKLLKKNRRALVLLSLSLQDKSVRRHYRDGRSPEYPKGLAWLVWQNLLDQYDLTDGVTSHELRSKMHRRTMKRDDDPYLLAMDIGPYNRSPLKLKHPFLMQRQLHITQINCLSSTCKLLLHIGER
jgi:hypothetical protein